MSQSLTYQALGTSQLHERFGLTLCAVTGSEMRQVVFGIGELPECGRGFLSCGLPLDLHVDF